MRFILVSLLLLLSTSAMAADKLIVLDSITVSKSAKPDIMHSNISVSVKGSSFSQASEFMEEYVNIFNKYSKICTSNSYSVSPEYVYNNNKREIIGYKSYMNIPCQFKSMKLFNELLSSITSDSNPIKADIILSSVNWVISSELQSSLNSQLKIDAIKQAGVTAKQMGESLGSECSILKVSFLNGVYSPSQPLFESAKLASVNVSQPNQSDKSVSITAKYKLKCF